jgi:hypothetical protein
MKRLNLRTAKIPLAIAVLAIGIAGVLAAAVAAGSFAWSADSTSLQGVDATAAPGATPAPPPDSPPPFNRWIRPDTGEFWVDPYDDRHLSEEAKAADPVYNPRWDPFAACIEDQSYEALAPGSAFFTQADMDALLARVNAERPDTRANRQVSNGDTLPGLAGAFLKCADEWLALTPEEAKALGFEEGKRSNYRPQ